MAASTETETAELRHATAVTSEEGDLLVKVKLITKGIVPPLLGNKTKPANGTLRVSFSPWGLNMEALVKVSKETSLRYHYAVKKLPSEIDHNASTYKVKKDMVVLKLIKKKAGSWVPNIGRGLEQAESDDVEG
ncbi:hypothetical protein PoB_002513000 [Plakobranchus ocellatus]|uniref:CS domain-containing protein n=1 Tax=Plakobranchus ocellatus TaxID=259542 RepID=A0AAV3ZU15_9GAST|nr:hypothetical protein PoB_002513000 [Plakobranchus ocellatus]